jgi:hypothetical protein
VTHLIKYTKADGQSGEKEVEELHDAIAQVERLRNEEGVDAAKIFRIEEVSFEFRPYYRVELGGAATPTPTLTTAPAPPPAPKAVHAMPEPPPVPIWAPPAEMVPAAAADAAPADDAALPPVPAAALLAEVEPAPMVDPWADAPPPPPTGDAEPAANGRRGLFGR